MEATVGELKFLVDAEDVAVEVVVVGCGDDVIVFEDSLDSCNDRVVVYHDVDLGWEGKL